MLPPSDGRFAAFQHLKDYQLDAFQIEACQALENDRGVLVCAPTGSGKTVVGEFAVALAVEQGTKCFYTTPIKALSNQKYHDFAAEYGEEIVGLLTGDVSINPSAPVVVMTTEVLRNMIYEQSHSLDWLSHVVMDEIHFLADPDRGAVWEEIILNLHPSVKLVGLSATVSNSEEFGEWLNIVRGDTAVIVSDHRPVPLQQHMIVGRKVFPLFEPGSDGRVNESLKRAVERIESGAYDQGKDDFREGRGFRSRSEGRRKESPARTGEFRPAGRPEIVNVLGGLNMLPAIVFIFSRAGCDDALFQCLRAKKELTTHEEQETIADIIDAAVVDIPVEDLEVLNFKHLRKAWIRGFAAHHAGMLPAFKHVVEKLFVQGLVRVVFATETLALGINMPARTVVLEKLVKFNGEGHVDLTPGQYTQLTGRAGRRGIDTVGNAVVRWMPAMEPDEVAGLASTRTYPLISPFMPGYNMAINMLSMNGYDASIRLIERSFAQFQTDQSVVGDAREIERIEENIAPLKEELERAVARFAPPSDDPVADLVDYLQLQRELNEEEKAARRRFRAERRTEVTKILRRLQVGQVIALPSKKYPDVAVVVQVAKDRDDPRPWVTTERGWSGRIDVDAFTSPPILLGRIKLPKHTLDQPRRYANKVAMQLRRERFRTPRRLKQELRNRPTQKMRALREALRSHPVHAWPAADRELLAGVGHNLLREQTKLNAMRSSIDASTDSLGRMFSNIIGLLTELDYVEVVAGEYVVTEEGERLARIHNVSDLLVAQALRRGIWDNLDPAELAGTVSMVIFENRRATYGAVELPTEAMVDAVNNTMRIYNELVSDEHRHGLPLSRMPDSSFALALHQWTAGAPLGYALAAAAESGAELTAGDFVRWCRQTIDLLEQIRKTGYSAQIRKNAERGIQAIRRGVVALGD